MKKVYIEPAGRWHSFLTQLKNTPPDGYEFVSPPTSFDKAIGPLLQNNFVYYTLQRLMLEKLVPMHIVKAWAEGRFKKTPPDIDLTYSIGHVIYRNEPWVIAVEWVTQLFGYQSAHLKRYHKSVEKLLASDNCKKIICWGELSKNTVLHNLNCASFADKIVIVPHAVNKKDFVKQPPTDKVKLLFVGSANIVGDFELKGGKEALEGFTILRQKYNNLEMVVRSDMPQEIKRKYNSINGLRIIDKILPWPEMEHEFQTADIFLFPGHHTPFMSFLDAMSYELPIITTNAYANAELVTDGQTGLLINCSQKVPYYLDKYLLDGSTSKFRKAIKTLDNAVVTELVEKTSLLIENADLRQKMGKAGRAEIENGRFSIKNRNEKLKDILDEATSNHK
jgi:glycosyltransferase involved in cell wall biosynthesis